MSHLYPNNDFSKQTADKDKNSDTSEQGSIMILINKLEQVRQSSGVKNIEDYKQMISFLKD